MGLGLLFISSIEAQTTCDGTVFVWKQLDDARGTCLTYTASDPSHDIACETMTEYYPNNICAKQYTLPNSSFNIALCQNSKIFNPAKYHYSVNSWATCTGDITSTAPTTVATCSSKAPKITGTVESTTYSASKACDLITGTLMTDCSVTYTCTCSGSGTTPCKINYYYCSSNPGNLGAVCQNCCDNVPG